MRQQKLKWNQIHIHHDILNNFCLVHNHKQYEKLNQPVPLYAQLGEDWDVSDVEAYFLSQGDDERLTKEYMGAMDCPEGKRDFFKLELLHFSPYTIYDVDPVSSSGDESQNLIPNNNGGNDNGTKDADTSENYSESEKPGNSGTDGQNSKDYEGNERIRFMSPPGIPGGLRLSTKSEVKASDFVI